jgi:hypothetical protein
MRRMLRMRGCEDAKAAEVAEDAEAVEVAKDAKDGGCC